MIFLLFYMNWCIKEPKKTEVILLGNNNIAKHIPSLSLHIDDISLEATDKVKKKKEKKKPEPCIVSPLF